MSSLANNYNRRNISFKYSNKGKDILKNISLEINKGDKVGIVGTTGSGKSTFLDIIIGLIHDIIMPIMPICFADVGGVPSHSSTLNARISWYSSCFPGMSGRVTWGSRWVREEAAGQVPKGRWRG